MNPTVYLTFQSHRYLELRDSSRRPLSPTLLSGRAGRQTRLMMTDAIKRRIALSPNSLRNMVRACSLKSVSAAAILDDDTVENTDVQLLVM